MNPPGTSAFTSETRHPWSVKWKSNRMTLAAPMHRSGSSKCRSAFLTPRGRPSLPCNSSRCIISCSAASASVLSASARLASRRHSLCASWSGNRASTHWSSDCTSHLQQPNMVWRRTACQTSSGSKLPAPSGGFMTSPLVMPRKPQQPQYRRVQSRRSSGCDARVVGFRARATSRQTLRLPPTAARASQPA